MSCAYALATQRITIAPYMALPLGLLYDLEALGMPLENRDPHAVAIAARVGVVRRSGVWEEVKRSIEAVAASDAAMLNPHRSWHSASVVGTLARTQEWVAAQGDEIQRTCREEEAKRVVTAIRGTREARRAALKPVLLKRMSCWSDTPEVETARIFAFVDTHPPVDVLATMYNAVWLVHMGSIQSPFVAMPFLRRGWN